jgi:hypothetical protein
MNEPLRHKITIVVDVHMEASKVHTYLKDDYSPEMASVFFVSSELVVHFSVDHIEGGPDRAIVISLKAPDGNIILAMEAQQARELAQAILNAITPEQN